jgi:hypothetical protein
MRPRSEIRQTVAAVAEQLHAQGNEPTWRDIAQRVPGIDLRSPADARLVRKTVENMLDAGELEAAGRRQAPSGRVMRTVRPRRSGWVHQGAAALDGVLRGWRG